MFEGFIPTQADLEATAFREKARGEFLDALDVLLSSGLTDAEYVEARAKLDREYWEKVGA